jgi:transcriptional regulator with XRE-family HTH domain
MAKRRLTINNLRTAEEFLNEQLENPEFREEWNRTALARAVSLRLIGYRSDHGLSQTQLAKKIGIKQPAVARLEAGEKNPTWETLHRLSAALGIEFLVDIAPQKKKWLVSKDVRKDAQVIEVTADGRTLVALR